MSQLSRLEPAALLGMAVSCGKKSLGFQPACAHCIALDAHNIPLTIMWALAAKLLAFRVEVVLAGRKAQ